MPSENSTAVTPYTPQEIRRRSLRFLERLRVIAGEEGASYPDKTPVEIAEGDDNERHSEGGAR